MHYPWLHKFFLEFIFLLKSPKAPNNFPLKKWRNSLMSLALYDIKTEMYSLPVLYVERLLDTLTI